MPGSFVLLFWYDIYLLVGMKYGERFSVRENHSVVYVKGETVFLNILTCLILFVSLKIVF